MIHRNFGFDLIKPVDDGLKGEPGSGTVNKMSGRFAIAGFEIYIIDIAVSFIYGYGNR